MCSMLNGVRQSTLEINSNDEYTNTFHGADWQRHQQPACPVWQC